MDKEALARYFHSIDEITQRVGPTDDWWTEEKNKHAWRGTGILFSWLSWPFTLPAEKLLCRVRLKARGKSGQEQVARYLNFLTLQSWVSCLDLSCQHSPWREVKPLGCQRYSEWGFWSESGPELRIEQLENSVDSCAAGTTDRWELYFGS